VVTPIYATSTYVQSSPGVHQGFEYSRSQNPTRFAYERCVADLEGGDAGFAFASGLAATSTVLELLDSGDHVVALDDIYGGTRRLFEQVRRRSAGLSFTYSDLRDRAALEAALDSENADDLGGNAQQSAAETGGFGDDRRMWPANARHSDSGRQHLRHALGAAAAGIRFRYRRPFRDQIPERSFRHHRRGCGVPGREWPNGWVICKTPSARLPVPFDSFLALRGLKTLALRMERHSSQRVAHRNLAGAASSNRAGDLSRLAQPSPA
jgi:cystathionine gamma-lyase